MCWKVPNIWEGDECWIIGGGPSMPRQFGVPEDIIQKVMANPSKLKPEVYSSYFSPIHDKHIIGINNVYQIGSWIDVLFFGDCNWQVAHKHALAEFHGLKVTSCPRWENKPKKKSQGIKFLRKDPKHKRGITADKTKISWNYNSGAAAISLAAHFGVKRIILLGFDMCQDQNGVTHWHGSHDNSAPRRKPARRPTRKPKKNKSYERHLRGFPDIAEDAKRMGIEIINANPKSAIDVFPMVDVGELL